MEVELLEDLLALLQQLPRVVPCIGIPALIYLHLLRESLLLSRGWDSKFQTDIMILVVLHLDLLYYAVDDIGSNNFDNFRQTLPVASKPIIEYFDIHGNVEEFPSVNISGLQETALDGKDIEVPQSLEVVPIVARRCGEDRIERADQCRQ